MRKENKYLIVVILVVIVGGLIFFINGRSFLESQKKQYQEDIIDCLLSRGVRLYISSDCDYCQEQRDVFGKKFNNIDSVKCDKNGNWLSICRQKKINSVPTWVFPRKIKDIKDNLISCQECRKRSGGIECKDYCYTESDDKNFFYISSFLSLDDLNEIFNCSPR